MTNVSIKLMPATISSVALAWFATQTPHMDSSLGDLKPAVEYRGASLGTFDFAFGRVPLTVVPAETASLMAFYTTLMAGQQDLGKEFEQVLFDNIWDLYAR
jgi:hypothetical protein